MYMERERELGLYSKAMYVSNQIMYVCTYIHIRQGTPKMRHKTLLPLLNLLFFILFEPCIYTYIHIMYSASGFGPNGEGRVA